MKNHMGWTPPEDSVIKVGVPLYLHAAPRNRGVVSRTGRDGFRVTWDDPERKRNQPRMRITYPWHMESRFTVGRLGDGQ